MVCHSLLQWTTFCQTSPTWPACLGWPHTAWLSFIELDKAVVHVIRLTAFLWLWFQCVCPLMPLATPTVLLGFLLPWKWGMSSRLLQQSTAAAPYLGRGVSPHRHPSWHWTWSSSSWPSCAHTATARWTWGCSSQLPPLTSAIYLEPDYDGGNEDKGDLLQKVLCTHCYTQCPQPCSWPPPTHTFTGYSWTLTGKSVSVSCGSLLLSPGSWCTRFCLCPPIIYFPVLCKFW